MLFRRVCDSPQPEDAAALMRQHTEISLCGEELDDFVDSCEKLVNNRNADPRRVLVEIQGAIGFINSISCRINTYYVYLPKLNTLKQRAEKRILAEATRGSVAEKLG